MSSTKKDFLDLLFTGIKPILSATKHITLDSSSQRPTASSSSAVTADNVLGEGSNEFIKVAAKHAVDKTQPSNAISGLLLLSADFIMFDPDPGDLQVQGRNIEAFSLIIPIMNIASVTLSKSITSLSDANEQIILNEDSKFPGQTEHITPSEIQQQDSDKTTTEVDHHGLPTLVTSVDEAECSDVNDLEAAKTSKDDDGVEDKITTGLSGVTFGTTGDKTSQRTLRNDEKSLEGVQKKEDNLETLSKKRTKSSSEVSEMMPEKMKQEDKDGEILAAAAEHKVFEKKRASSVRKERPLAIVGNFFRFGGSDSFSDVSSPAAAGKDAVMGSGVGSTSVENVSGSPGGTRLVTRTISSLSSYSSSLIDDFSTHLFSSPSGTPKLQAISASPSSPAPSPSSLTDRQVERVFFLKPIDALTKKVKEQLSSTTESAGDDEEKDIELFLQIKTLVTPSSNFSDLMAEYLFIVQPDKSIAPMLFTFFLYWSPDSQKVQSSKLSCFDEPWFVLADQTSEESAIGEKQGFNSGNVQEIEQKKKGKEWKIVNVEEVKRLLRIAEIEKLPLPELSMESDIMDGQMVKQLTFHLPPRAEGCKWDLVYSTERHGFSLKTLFRRLENVEGPILIIIKDDRNQIFGAMLSCTLKPCDTFYGTGECYLFSFYKKFKKYGWTGLNNYFIYTPPTSISIGSGEGAFGLWLDGDLYYGRTQTCLTFGNDPLTENEDFIIRCLETWRFV